MSRWTLENGSYYLWDGPEGAGRAPRKMVDQLAMAFDRGQDADTSVLFKVDSPEEVEAWLKGARKKLEASDERAAREMVKDFGMVTLPRGFPVDEVNRCMDTAGYIWFFLEAVESFQGRCLRCGMPMSLHVDGCMEFVDLVSDGKGGWDPA